MKVIVSAQDRCVRFHVEAFLDAPATVPVLERSMGALRNAAASFFEPVRACRPALGSRCPPRRASSSSPRGSAKGLPPRAAAPEELASEHADAAGQKTLEKLVDAWERRKRVTIAYWRVATDKVVERQLDVYGWASRRGEWIVVGHDSLRNAVRIFYVSRIRKLKVNTVRAQDPDYSVPDDFDIRRSSRQQIWDYDVHAPQPAMVRFRVKGALSLAAHARGTPEEVESLDGGWVAEEALAIGLFCALVARDFEHGVLLAANHGGDSDSTGSIAGNLLGLLGGEEGIPDRRLRRLELREVIAQVADDLWACFGDTATPEAGADVEKYPPY